MGRHLPEMIRLHAREHGAHPAISTEGRTLSYAELDRRTNRLAQALLAAAPHGARIGSLLMITGGENVYPVEVESVLAEHPAVADVAVIGLPHERWGEEVTPGGTRSAPPPETISVSNVR